MCGYLYSPTLCVSVILVCTHICMTAHIHVYIHEYTGLTLGVFLDHSSLLFLETGSLITETKSHWFSQALATLPGLKLKVCLPHLAFCVCVLGTELKSFCIHGKHFTDQAISPAHSVQSIVWHSPACISLYRNGVGHPYLVVYSEDEMMQQACSTHWQITGGLVNIAWYIFPSL